MFSFSERSRDFRWYAKWAVVLAAGEIHGINSFCGVIGVFNGERDMLLVLPFVLSLCLSGSPFGMINLSYSLLCSYLPQGSDIWFSFVGLHSFANGMLVALIPGLDIDP